jgi:hypothetical protein
MAIRFSGRPSVIDRTSRQVLRGQNPFQLPGSNPGQQHHHLELGREEPGSELKGRVILFERQFAHGRRYERLSTLFADQFSNFLRPAALQAQHTLSSECHSSILRGQFGMV